MTMDAFSAAMRLVRSAPEWPAGQTIVISPGADGLVRIERRVAGRLVNAYEGAPGEVAKPRKPAADPRQLALVSGPAVSPSPPPEASQATAGTPPVGDVVPQELLDLRALLTRWKDAKTKRERDGVLFDLDTAREEAAEAVSPEADDALCAEFEYPMTEPEPEVKPKKGRAKKVSSPNEHPVAVEPPGQTDGKYPDNHSRALTGTAESYRIAIVEDDWDSLTQTQRDEVAALVEDIATWSKRDPDVHGVAGGVELGPFHADEPTRLEMMLEDFECPYQFTAITGTRADAPESDGVKPTKKKRETGPNYIADSAAWSAFLSSRKTEREVASAFNTWSAKFKRAGCIESRRDSVHAELAHRVPGCDPATTLAALLKRGAK